MLEFHADGRIDAFMSDIKTGKLRKRYADEPKHTGHFHATREGFDAIIDDMEYNGWM